MIKPKSRKHEDRIKALEEIVDRLISQSERQKVDLEWFYQFPPSFYTDYQSLSKRDKNYPAAESSGAKWWQFWR